MTRRLNHAQLLARKEIVRSPTLPNPRACNDHSFELPAQIYAAMGLLFAGALAVLAIAFQRHMAVSYGIVFAFLAAFFAVPTIFVKASPGDGVTLSWREFRRKGIQTATGLTNSMEATVLVLLLPAAIFCWAIAIATIAAVLG